MSVKLDDLKFFGLKKLIDLSREARNAFDYVLAEDLVHVIREIRNSKSIDIG